MNNEEIKAAVEGAVAGHESGSDMEEYDISHKWKSGREQHRPIPPHIKRECSIIEQIIYKQRRVQEAMMEEMIADGVTYSTGGKLINTLELQSDVDNSSDASSEDDNSGQKLEENTP